MKRSLLEQYLAQTDDHIDRATERLERLSRLEQLRPLAASIEHPALHGVAGYAEDARRVLHRFFMVVDEVDDFAMIARQACEASAQHLGAMLALERNLGIVRAVADFGDATLVAGQLGPASQLAQRFIAGDGEQPGGDAGAAFESMRLLPDAQENLAGEILGRSVVAGRGALELAARGLALSSHRHRASRLAARGP